MFFSFKRLRRRLSRWYRNSESQIVPLVFILVLCVIISIISYHMLFAEIGFTHMLARNFLIWGMPSVGSEQLGYPGWQYTMRSVIYMLTDYDIGNPVSFFESTIPVLAHLKTHHAWENHSFVFFPELEFAAEPENPSHRSLLDVRVPVIPPEPDTRLPNQPKILIYHTHSSEMYLGLSTPQQIARDSHYVFKSAYDDKITGVMDVGRHLTNVLNNYGIYTIHEPKIHDFPSLAYSYINSEKTLIDILKRHNSIEFVFDVHRDARIPEPVVTINGQKVAKILLVVGTAKDIPRDNPYWQENIKLAQKIQALGESMYPGLFRPLLIRDDARYNQHLTPGSLLLEIGSVENTVEEALLSTELLAGIIAKVIRERI